MEAIQILPLRPYTTQMKVLLIEDEVKFVQSLQQGLTEQDIAVDFAYDGRAGYELAAKGEYDVIVSDVVMPYLDGIQMVRQLRHINIKTPILLLTALDATDDKVEGLEAGADDYLVKPFEFKELVARIKALARRGSGQQPDARAVLAFADIEMNLDSKVFMRSGQRIELTPKEFALMEYFIRHQGRTISKAEIADKVWDINFETTSNVVEVYINYLRNKMDKPFGKKLIHTHFGVGYALEEE